MRTEEWKVRGDELKRLGVRGEQRGKKGEEWQVKG